MYIYGAKGVYWRRMILRGINNYGGDKPNIAGFQTLQRASEDTFLRRGSPSVQLIQAISIAPLQSTTTQRCSRDRMDTVSKLQAETPLATASKRLAQGPYTAARAGLEPTTLLT